MNKVKSLSSHFSEDQSAYFNLVNSSKPKSLFASCSLSHVNNLDVVKTSEPSHKSVYSFIALQSVNANVLHRRLGHPTPHILKTIFKDCNSSAGFNKIEKLSFCNICQYGKNHLLHFNSVEIKTRIPLQLIYVDL